MTTKLKIWHKTYSKINLNVVKIDGMKLASCPIKQIEEIEKNLYFDYIFSDSCSV